MPADHRTLVADPLASVWHPEEVHRSMLHGLFSAVCDGDTSRFHDAIVGATELGIHKFARLILQMSSTAFVLRRVPTLWHIIRRGPASTKVEQGHGITRLTYSGFPYFDDVLYRHYIVGVLTGIAHVSGGVVPDVSVLEHSADGMIVEVRFPTGEPAEPAG